MHHYLPVILLHSVHLIYPPLIQKQKLKTIVRKNLRVIPAFIFIVNINTDTFGDTHIQYHDFNNGDAFTYKDKYTTLLQQELQTAYWCLHNPVTTKSYQISTEMDIETMPHAMYFSGNTETVTKINHVPYQMVQYDENGVFPAQLMDDTPIQVFF